MDLSAVTHHKGALELFPTVLDRKAAETPDKIWASMPKDVNDLPKGFYDISWRDASKAWNLAARSLEKIIGRAARRTPPTVAYIGPSDLRYFYLTVALAKLGYKILLLQATLSVKGQLSLLEKTDCQYLVYGSWMPSLDTVLAERAMKTFQAPTMDELQTIDQVLPYPFEYQPCDLLNTPALVLHTSGSTGLPKPANLTYGGLAANALSHEIPYLSGHINNWRIISEMKRFYIGFPIAHAGGVQVMINVSAYNDATLVLVESGNLSGDLFEGLIDHADIGGTLIMPRPLIEIAKSPTGVKKLSKLRGIIFSGGPLPCEAGLAISRSTTLMSSWGTTESGAQILHATDPEDWEYIHINPTYNNFRFDPVGSSGLYEIVAVPHREVRLRHHQKIFWNQPHVPEWPFGDLFSPHPIKPHLWKFEGRMDDMIILDSGHNFHPTFYEQEILLKDSRVKAAVILGNGRPSLVAILELRDTENVKDIWPLIQTVNQRSSKMAQIPVGNVILAKPEKPLPRGGKGSVIRKDAEKLYKTELDRIHS